MPACLSYTEAYVQQALMSFTMPDELSADACCVLSACLSVVCPRVLAHTHHMHSIPGLCLERSCHLMCARRRAGKGAVYTYDAVGSHERVGFSCQARACPVHCAPAVRACCECMCAAHSQLKE